MNNKVTASVVGIAAALALVFSLVSYNKTPSVVTGNSGVQGMKGDQGPTGPQGPQGERGPAGRDGVNGISKVGAIPTLDGVDYPFVSIGGEREYYYSQPISATSSTFCSLKNPFNATSTVVRYSVQVNTGILGANAFDVSTSSNATGTSTPAYIASAVLASTLGNTYLWTGPVATTTALLIGGQPSTNSGQNLNGLSNNILFPNQYVTAKIATTTPGTFAGGYLTGTCAGIIRKI